MSTPAVLTDARDLVAPAMEHALTRLSPEIRRVVDYHMGWRDAAGLPVNRRGSKSVRPALTFMSARAGGGEPRDAIPGSLAVELINNWSFLLDDVMDKDRFRRQRETAWVVFGVGQAICAGSALLTVAHEVLLECDSPGRLVALQLTLDTTARMLAGQTLDMTFERRLDVTLDESMTMTASKTASLLSCATGIGAVLVGASDEVVAGLTEFGHRLGIAFQARDDLLGVWGRPEQTGGRPPGFDVRARKGTLPIVVALNAGTGGSDELRDLLARPELSDADVARAIGIIEATGGREWTADLARRMVAGSLEAIAGLDLADELYGQLASVAAMGRPDDV